MATNTVSSKKSSKANEREFQGGNGRFNNPNRETSGNICEICYEIVVEKTPVYERRFGILSNCNHVFCLHCIRTWRSEDQYSGVSHEAIRSCPTCRVHSDFYVTSRVWVDRPEEKMKLITDYKSRTSKIHCKYYKQGSGKCPFKDKCFYKHENLNPRPQAPKGRAIRTQRNGHNPPETHDGTEDGVDQMLMLALLQARMIDSLDSDSEDGFNMFDSDSDMENYHWLNLMIDGFSDDDLYKGERK